MYVSDDMAPVVVEPASTENGVVKWLVVTKQKEKESMTRCLESHRTLHLVGVSVWRKQ